MRESHSSKVRLVVTCSILSVVIGLVVGRVSVRGPSGEETSTLPLSQLKLGSGKTAKLPSSARPGLATAAPSRASTEFPLATEEEVEAFKAWQKEDARLAMHEMVSRASAENSAGYRGLLSELGLDGTIIDQLQSNLVALHYMAADAGAPLEELAVARSQHDKYMRSLLDEDAYKRYRKYEESKPAVREYEMIREYAATKRGVLLDERETAKLVDLIRDTGATTTVSWHGPYDPLPRPIAGAQAIDKLQTDYLSLVNSADSLLASAYEAGVSEEIQQILKEYYTDKTQTGHDKWIYWNRPIDDIRAELRVRASQEMIEPQPVVSP